MDTTHTECLARAILPPHLGHLLYVGAPPRAPLSAVGRAQNHWGPRAEVSLGPTAPRLGKETLYINVMVEELFVLIDKKNQNDKVLKFS